MFFRSRRRHPVLTALLILMGFKLVSAKQRMTDAERAACKAKAKTFRQKLREAFAVWDDETSESAPESQA